jgi:nicotinate-nucleotide adenylyltransferase
VGLLGGSFDPVHAGHLHAARAALEAFDLERVVFVPAARAPHKPARPTASDRDRWAMLALAIADEPRFELSDLELRRGGVSYTIDTVAALPAALGLPDDLEIYLILGSDNLPGLPRWHRAQELLERVRPIVVHRAGEPQRWLDALRSDLGAELFAKLEAGYLRLPPVAASSTHVRARLTDPGHDPGREALEVPAPVREYIRTHAVYGARP